MNSLKGKTFVVLGATGRQGSAVVRHLLQFGAHVKALTRTPHSQKAKAVAALGAEVVAGELANPDTLKNYFKVLKVFTPYRTLILLPSPRKFNRGKM